MTEGFERLATVLGQGPGLALTRSATKPDPDAGDDTFWLIEDKVGTPAGTALVEALHRFTPRTMDEFKARHSLRPS